MSAATCFALALTLGSIPFPISFDGTTILNHDPLVTLTDVSITSVKTGLTTFNFSSTSAAFWLPTGSTYSLGGVIKNASDADPFEVAISLDLVLSPGLATFNNSVEPGTCLVTQAVVNHCTLQLSFANPSVLPIANVSLISALQADELIASVIDQIDEQLQNKSVCDALAASIAHAVVAVPDDQPLPLPPAPDIPLNCDLRDSELVQMAENIVSNLPPLDGLTFGLVVPTANAMRVMVQAQEINAPPLTLGSDLISISIPANTGISMDLVFNRVRCPAANSIQILDNVTVMNIRLTDAEGSTVARIFDDLDAPIGALVTEIFRGLSRSLPANDTSITFTIPTHSGTTAPFYTMALCVSGVLILGIACATMAAKRHRGKVLLDQDGNEVSRWSLIAGDAILIVGCCFTMVCFAWSNQTAAAKVTLGGKLALYNFGLASSIDDMWDAGLYALSVFIAVFCGFYPYFKLLSILLFSVVLQRPQSKVLRFIDTCGKFSLLDSFVMIILAEGLAVPGIVDVQMGPSFWVFLAATVSSIALGNYATHGWRAELSLGDAVNTTPIMESSPILGRGNTTPRAVSYRGAYIEDMSPNSAISRASMTIELDRNRSERHPFRPIIAGVCFVLMVVGLGLTVVFDTVEFNNSGFGATITGAHIKYTLPKLVNRCPKPLTITAIITVFIMPLLFVAGYSKTRALAAWCAPDTFLLAGVAGLFQMEQFVKFVLGDTFQGVITIKAELLWPSIGLGVSVVVLWILIATVVFF